MRSASIPVLQTSVLQSFLYHGNAVEMSESKAQTDTLFPKPFRVIIIGAGIVGLTLSHALQLAKVDHVVLEKNGKVVSVRGAAVIIWPNAERIFDQLGFLPKILDSTTPVTKEYRRWPDGTVNNVANTMSKFNELYVGFLFLLSYPERIGSTSIADHVIDSECLLSCSTDNLV